MSRESAWRFVIAVFGFFGGLLFQVGIEGVYWHDEQKQSGLWAALILLLVVVVFVAASSGEKPEPRVGDELDKG